MLVVKNGKIRVEKALAHKPDFVVCDIMMPVLDGYGVLVQPKLSHCQPCA